jgi:hypothetical protein
MKKNHIHLSNWEAFVLNLTVSLVTISVTRNCFWQEESQLK